MKIVINAQYGGFSLSTLAIKEYLKLKNKEAYFYDMEIENREIHYKRIQDDKNGLFMQCFTKDFGEKFYSKDFKDEELDKYLFNTREINRTDKDLITVIEKLGEKSNTMCSTLKIIEIPDDVDWIIEEYDGNEWVAEKHSTWN